MKRAARTPVMASRKSLPGTMLTTIAGLIFPGLLFATTSTVVTDPTDEKWDYTFEENLGVLNLVSRTSQTDGKGIIRQFDANNNLISITDEEGRVTIHTYNKTNQRTATTEALGTAEARTTSFEYVSPDVDLPIRVTTPSVYTGFLRQVLTTYDTNLNVTAVTIQGYRPDGAPVSRTSTFQYNGVVITRT